MAYKYVNDYGLNAYTKKVKGALKDLHTPIAISIENTTESKAQNVKNMADFVAKAKAAGIADVNGMAVTCLIDDNYSGVGYLTGNPDTPICGLETYDSLEAPAFFSIESDGSYISGEVLVKGLSGQVTSLILDKGARKPIILTPETTEVDEETYQKLFPNSITTNDVDVMFRIGEYDIGDFLSLISVYIQDSEGYNKLDFAGLSCGNTLQNTFLMGYSVTIETGTPHKCVVNKLQYKALNAILSEAGYLDKSTLSPVLQEIDLTGTDAQRKARLAQFETDWRNLTGASDMTGARFVGRIEVSDPDADRNYTGIFIRGFYDGREYFSGFICGSNYNKQVIFFAILRPGTGTLTITPLATQSAVDNVLTLANAVKAFGAIELKASDNAANKAALTAYLKVLTDAGVSTTNGYSVPVRITGNAQEYHGMLNIGTGALLSGIVTDVNENHHYPFNVSTADGAITFDANNYFLEKTSNEVTEMLDAIKYSYTPVPLTATTLSNKAQLEVFLSKVPNAQVMHCTYKDVYAGTLHKINGDWFGLLVKNTNNYEDALQVKLQADGTLIEGTTSLAQVNAKLNTIIG